MKKSFAVMLSAFLIICVFTVSSFATSSVLSVQADKSEDNNLVVVIGFDDVSSICGGNFTFSYNDDKLSLSDYYTQNSGYTAEINPNYNNSGNSVRCSFFSATPIQNGKNLAVLKFTLKNNNIVSEDLNLSDYRLYNENAELVSDGVKNPAVITINSLASQDVSKLVENISGSDFTNYAGNNSSVGELVSPTNADGSVADNTVSLPENTSVNNDSGDYSSDVSFVTEEGVLSQKNETNKNRKSKTVLAVSLIISVVAIGVVAVVVTVINKKKK